MNLEKLVQICTLELLSLEQRFSKVFQDSPQMLSIIRKSDFRFIEVNKRFLRVASCFREEVIAKTPVELGLPQSKFEELRRLQEKQGSIENMEISLVTEKDEQIFILFSAKPIDLNGEECILVASSDITEMKRMQAEIARLAQLNLVGQMVAGIGHEIRNPMTTVRGYLQMLGTKSEFRSHRTTFETMISELDRANSIITEFLS